MSEALACNLPMAVFDAIPGQEEDNANFLKIHDMGVRLQKDGDFAQQISSLLKEKEKLQEMRENCQHFDKSQSIPNLLAPDPGTGKGGPMMAPFSPQDCAALRRELESLADPAYKAFNESLLPGVETAYGIRLPQMRQVAKALLRQDPAGFLEHFQPNCYEETQLRGLVIGG